MANSAFGTGPHAVVLRPRDAVCDPNVVSLGISRPDCGSGLLCVAPKIYALVRRAMMENAKAA